ncbi:D-glucuronyl C5-epimerase family protein [Acidobacteria bacterium AH-259-L09]|nr:D-glucuronyl C5-epimerase family protein [Acidobacteria bacterium AH-259-L09]
MVNPSPFSRLKFYRRLFETYILRRGSNLTFWHERPEVNAEAQVDQLGPYYMTFLDKAGYAGPFDGSGIPLLDYAGSVGLQYNPIAIAQYGLGHYNLFRQTGEERHRAIFFQQVDWLKANLELNYLEVPVWMHHFDWEYRWELRAPWHSGLAQGCALSCLSRAFGETGEKKYEAVLRDGFSAFLKDMREGGVCRYEPNGDVWIEEVILEPPSHILNGFIWGLWGVWDYYLCTGEGESRSLFDRCTETLRRHLHRYDSGSWSLYELSPYHLQMVASPFYHRLHIVQLKVMHRLTGDSLFADYAERWESYQRSWWNRIFNLAKKVVFKLFHY